MCVRARVCLCERGCCVHECVVNLKRALGVHPCNALFPIPTVDWSSARPTRNISLQPTVCRLSGFSPFSKFRPPLIDFSPLRRTLDFRDVCVRVRVCVVRVCAAQDSLDEALKAVLRELFVLAD